MTAELERDLQATYADVLPADADPVLLGLVRQLEAGYASVSAPPALRTRIPSGRPPGGMWRPVPWPLRRHILRSRRAHALVALAVCCLLVVIGSIGLAGDEISKLGRPTNDVPTNPYFPLSGFHRANLHLQANGRPVLLWLGTQWGADHESAGERWAVVKALSQFGTFSRLNSEERNCPPPNRFGYYDCSPPTYDWSAAGYHSRYLVFSHREMLDAHAHLFQRLNRTEQAIFDRYVRRQPGAKAAVVAASVSGSGEQPTSHTFPLLAIGGYLQTITQVPTLNDFSFTLPTLATHLLSFDEARDALIQGREPGKNTMLVKDVNAETNVITALICHVDHSKPASVCGRPTIRRLLRLVRGPA